MNEGLDNWNAVEQENAAVQTPEEREMHLRNLVAAGGVTGLLASELLEAIDDRRRKADQEQLAATALAALETGHVDFDSPEARVHLSSLAAEERQAISDKYVEARRAEYVGRFGDETAEQLMANERGATREVETFLGEAQPSDLAVVHEYERRQAEQAKADDAAWGLTHRDADGWASELAEAEEQIAAIVARHAVVA